MRNYTEEEIINKIKGLENLIENDWSKFGDLSGWVRRDLIIELRKIRRMIKAPRRVDFSKFSKMNIQKSKKSERRLR